MTPGLLPIGIFVTFGQFIIALIGLGPLPHVAMTREMLVQIKAVGE